VADRLDPETVAASAAGALFVERARAVEPRFAINVENAQAVSEICERLDGLPLALELAASWVRLLGPHKLLARLDSRLALLTRGPRDLPVRQQSMRAAIAWSYQLLDPDTQRLFSRLGVFAGGWTLEAAEELCCEDVLHQLATLLDHSLVQQREGRRREPRFLMLETIREYALERLAAEGQLDTLRRRHAAWAHALVVRAETQMWGTGQEEWLDRLDDEHANLRAALGWSRQSGDGLLALELAAGANQFWWYRGHLAEGRDWLERALAHGADQPPALRAKALRGLTTIARLQGDYAYADERGREALTLSRQSNDLPGVVRALAYLSNVALARDRPARAAALLDESVALGREIGGTDLALPTLNRANLALSQRDYENTLELSREAAKLFRELGNAEGLATSLFNIASALLRQGRHVEALPSVLESLTLFERMGYDYGVALCLESVASVLAAEGSLIDAVRLLGAADALLQSSGATRELPEFEGVQSTVASLRRQLPTTTIEMEYAKGRSLTREQALALARRGAALHAQPGGDLRGSLAHR
jgi:tetratricopeptide (TPR) repeat protein